MYRFKLIAMVLKMSARNVSLPDELIALVNQKAIKQKRSFSSVVVEALQRQFKHQLAKSKTAA